MLRRQAPFAPANGPANAHAGGWLALLVCACVALPGASGAWFSQPFAESPADGEETVSDVAGKPVIAPARRRPTPQDRWPACIPGVISIATLCTPRCFPSADADHRAVHSVHIIPLRI